MKSKTIFKKSRLSFHFLSMLVSLFFLLLVSQSSYAQNNYTDLKPIQNLAPGISLDINKDGLMDIEFITETIKIPNVGLDKTFKINTSESLHIALENDSASALLRNQLIDESSIWSSTTEVPFQTVLLHYFEGGIVEAKGNWSRLPSVPDESNFYNAYLGFKIIINNQVHYGWIRLNFDIERKQHVLDFCYNETPNQQILAGEGMPMGAKSLYAKGYHYWRNENKIRINFVNEDRLNVIDSYRVIIAKANDETCNDLEIMNSIPSNQYHYVHNNPGNNEFLREPILLESTLDKDGDPMERFVDYKVYILSIAESGDSTENIISDPSPTFFLQNNTESVSWVSAFDNGNSNTSEDIEVRFPTVRDIGFVNEFRVYIYPYTDISDFTLEQALELSDHYYTSKTADSLDNSVVINADHLDTEGNSIEKDIYYQAYVVTIPDSAFSRISMLSPPSYKFKLNNPNTYYAGSKSEEHVNSFPADSLDLEYQYWHGPGGGQTSGNTNIDVNNDGLDDFNFIGHFYHSYASSSNYLGINSLRDNKVLICDHSGHENWILPLNEGEEISEDSEWSTDTVMLLHSYYHGFIYQDWSYGHFNNPGSYYVGLCINDYENPQYAWINFDYKRYMEYGFQDINSGLKELGKSNLYLYPNPSSDFVNINFKESSFQSVNLSISILNSAGIVVQEISEIRPKTSINMRRFSKGLYLFVIKDNDRIIETQKIIIE